MSVGWMVVVVPAVAAPNWPSGSTVKVVLTGRSMPRILTTRRSESVSTGAVLRNNRPGVTQRTVSGCSAVTVTVTSWAVVPPSSRLPIGVNCPEVAHDSPL